MSQNVMVVYGTHPEAIKLAPLIQGLQRHRELQPVLVSTGQHREMLAQVNAVFRLAPDQDIEVFEAGQPLNTLSAKMIARLREAIAALLGAGTRLPDFQPDSPRPAEHPRATPS